MRLELKFGDDVEAHGHRLDADNVPITGASLELLFATPTAETLVGTVRALTDDGRLIEEFRLYAHGGTGKTVKRPVGRGRAAIDNPKAEVTGGEVNAS